MGFHYTVIIINHLLNKSSNTIQMHNSAFSIQKLSEKNTSIISNQYHRKVKDIYKKKS